MTPNNRILALAFGALVLAAPAAHATLAAAASFDEKVENATSIVLGKCVKTESRLDPTGRWILTYSTFSVEKTMKGAAGSQITIVTPGGVVGSTHQETIGVPQFHEGDEHVLFVKDSRVGPTVLYFEQGAYDVSDDGRGEKVVAPVHATVVKIDTQRGVAVPEESPRTMRRFESDINDVMRNRQRRIENELIRGRQKQHDEASLGAVLSRYKFIIAAALLGAALATWQLLRK